VAAEESQIRRVGVTCRTAAEGRRAARALAEWAQRFELGEPDAQVLWCLRRGPAGGLDQTTLAKQLACSPAQVSATVERMRSRGWITPWQRPGDRRRNLWRLSPDGNRLVDEMLAAAGFLPPWESNDSAAVPPAPDLPREAAA
jgi:DNA-binding MarR family transcriptional regulator